MGNSASLISNLTPELQAEIQEEYNKLTTDGIPEDEIQTILKGKYAEQLSAGTPVPTTKKVIICGAPASGKGTQCEWIRDEFKLVHLSTGDMLRAAVAAGTDVGMEAKEYMDKGLLIPDETMMRVIFARLQEADCVTQGWLLDGFPRTLAQSEGLAAAGINCDIVIHLDVPEEILVDRVVGRRLDPVTGIIYHMTYKPPPDEEVAARLQQRSDDTAEKAQVRIDAFKSHLASIMEFFKDKIRVIDGNRDPQVVWADVKVALSA
jgi:adenylate kinase